VLQHHVVGRDIDAGADQRHAGRGRGLARDGQVGLRDLDLSLREVDDTADFEHDDARPVCFESREQRARSVRRQGRDAQDLAAAPAGRARRRSLRFGEGGEVVRGARSGPCGGEQHGREQMDAQAHRNPLTGSWTSRGNCK
jgi:hypothetical protein